MAININIKLEKKQLYLFAAIMVFLVGVGYVIAVNPAVHGHSVIDGNLQINTVNDGQGMLVISPTAGDTHLPYTDNWNYLSGKGVKFRNTGNNVKVEIDTTGTEGKVRSTKYCNLDGSGCKTIAELSSSTFGKNNCRTIECGNDCGFACNAGEYMAGMQVVGASCGGECVWASITCCTP